MDLRLDPSFLEEAVWLMLRHPAAPPALSRSFQAEREALYAAASPAAEREEAFQRLTATYVDRLGLRALFQAWLQEMPLLHRLEAIMVQRVWSPKEEAAELYLREAASPREAASVLVLGLQAACCQEPQTLRAWLRHEGLRASDMLDTAFAYTSQPVLGGSSDMEQDLIRDRFRLLWDRWIMVRMQRRGWPLAVAPAIWERQFARAFDGWPAEARHAICRQMTDAAACTQGALLTLAQDARGLQPMGAGGILCPLCHFPTMDGVSDWSGPLAAAAEVLRRDYPWWEITQGACRQCAELALAQGPAPAVST
jgi:hypothetical protein